MTFVNVCICMFFLVSYIFYLGPLLPEATPPGAHESRANHAQFLHIVWLQ